MSVFPLNRLVFPKGVANGNVDFLSEWHESRCRRNNEEKIWG